MHPTTARLIARMLSANFSAAECAAARLAYLRATGRQP